MKKKTGTMFTVLLILTVFSSVHLSSRVGLAGLNETKEAIVNGGFESGEFTGWSVSPDGSAAVVTTNPHSGEYCACIAGVRLYQDLQSPQGIPTSSIRSIAYCVRTEPESNNLWTLELVYSDSDSQYFINQYVNSSWSFFDVTSQLEPNKALKTIALMSWTLDGNLDGNFTLTPINTYYDDVSILIDVLQGETPTGENVTVFPSDDVRLIFEKVNEAGFTTATEVKNGPATPPGRKRVAQCYDIETTANYSGKIAIRMAYNDSELTGQEEEGLQLVQWNSTGARLEGDITGPGGWQDGKVDIMDIFLVAKAFGTDPLNPRWNALADLNGDGKVDIKDIFLEAKSFGRTIQQWINITNQIDTENNLIYGETSHLSIFTVH